MTPNSTPVTKRTAVCTSQLVHLISTHELLESHNSEIPSLIAQELNY